MDQNVKSLANLKEAFRGCIDPEVVDLIFTESNCVVNDALEKLLSISDNWTTDSHKKPTQQKGAVCSDDFSPTDTNNFKKAHKAASFRDEKSNFLDVEVKEREIPLDSSGQPISNLTKEAVEPKDSFSFDTNHHHTNSTLHSGVQSEIEVTDQPLSNQLPPWPDYNQGYLHHSQSFPHQPHNAYQGVPNPYNFQGQTFTGDAGYFHYTPQYQPQQNMGTYHPRSALFPPGIGYQPIGLHPGQSTFQNRVQTKRKEFQPYFGMRKPQREEKDAFSKHQMSEETLLPQGKVLVILRGLPGSGKTTLAQKLKRDGLILSTDDFFMRNGKYQFEQNDLAEAHEWNQRRAKEAMQRGLSPVIIDNTNMQAWEMRPYVSMSQRFGYKTIIKEPNTPWKWNTKELLKRNQHNVTLFSIKNMRERYERDLTVEAILANTLEKHGNISAKIEMCRKNEDETSKQDNESSNPMVVAPKERSRTKPASPELSSASINDKDVSNSGVTVESQFVNKFVARDNPPSISQPSNQSSIQSKPKSEDARLEMGTLRSHGSRSPIQDIDFSLPEISQASHSLEINKSFNKIGNDNTKVNFVETILPKPQRSPKRRERMLKPLEKVQTTDYMEVKKNPSKVLDFKEAEINLCENEPAHESHAISESKKPVVFISEEEENGEDNVQKFITVVANGKNTFCKTDSSNEITETHHSKNEIHLKDGQFERDVISLGKEDPASDATEKQIAISPKKETEDTGPSIPRHPLTTDESMTFDTIGKKISLESHLAKEIKKGQNENNTDKKVNVKETDYRKPYLLAKTNDWDEPFENTKLVPGFLKRPEKTSTEKKSSIENFKNDLSESELNGFHFLNTCFPDMDIQFLVDVLAKNQGDVTKAVESILSHENNSSEVKSQKQNMSDIDSSGKSSLQTSCSERKSAYTTPDQNLKTLQGCHFQDSQAPKSFPSLQSTNYLHHVGHDHGHFQMTLEPAVAIQLLELFGPIDSVSLEGDFSSNDLIVKVDSDFAKLLYNQWQTTIQNKIKKRSSHADSQPQVSRTENKEDSDKRLKDIHGKKSFKHLKATDLRQIMDEQMAVEQSRQEQEQPNESMAVVLKRQKLYAMFPGIDPLALDELFEANRYELQPTVSMVETSCNLQAKQTEFQEKQISQSSRSYDDSHGELKTEFQALQDPDYEDFRAEANTHYKLRDECFRKAAFAFSKKEGQLAQFYASQGHMHTEKIREANRRAATRILEHKNSNGDQNSLDLHGLHVDEALFALEEKLLFSDSSNNRPRYLSVITGQGIHSKQGKAKIKPAVLEYLQRNNYRFEELQPGLVRVSLNK